VTTSWTRTTKGEFLVANSIRDSQRQRVYDAEAFAFEGTGRDEEFKTLPDYKTVAECQQYVDCVTSSDTWTKVLGVETYDPVTVRDGRGSRSPTAFVEDDFISLPRWDRRRWAILHELAHIATFYRHDQYYDDEYGGQILERTTADHGPEYAGVYLFLVRSFLGEEAHQALLESFGTHRVKVVHIEVEDEPEEEVAAVTEVPQVTQVSVTDTDTRCLECGMVLAASAGPMRRFCSDKCRWDYHNRARHERLAQEWRRTCEICGTSFEAHRNNARFCSARCRKRAQRQRTLEKS
jgi:putative metallohydrolase (TIGR04338 family)